MRKRAAPSGCLLGQHAAAAVHSQLRASPAASKPRPLAQLVLVFPKAFWPEDVEVLNRVAPWATPGAWSETYNMLPHTGGAAAAWPVACWAMLA